MQNGFFMKRSITLLLSVTALAVGSVGCNREASEPAVETANPEMVAPSNVMAGTATHGQPGAVLDVPPGADTDAVLAELSREIRKWILRHRRTPNSFEEFMSTTPMQIPPPPAGMKYVLTREMKVVLEKR